MMTPEQRYFTITVTEDGEILARLSCKLRKEIYERERPQIVLCLGDVATLGLFHAHVPLRNMVVPFCSHLDTPFLTQIPMPTCRVF